MNSNVVSDEELSSSPPNPQSDIIQNQPIVHISLFPSTNREVETEIKRLLSSCYKFEWSRPDYECRPRVLVDVINSDRHLQIVGPMRLGYAFCCGICTGTTFPFKCDEMEVASFTYSSITCTPCLAKPEQVVDVFLPEIPEPIGKIEYIGRGFSTNKVKIVEYETDRVFYAIPNQTQSSALPSMTIVDSLGQVVGFGRVSRAIVTRGIAGYKEMSVGFSVEMSANLKCLLMVFGTIWEMDNQQSNTRVCYFAFIVALILVTCLTVIFIFVAKQSS